MAVANDLAMTLVITLMLMGLNVVGDFVVDGGLKKHLGSLSQGGLKGVLADGACSFPAKDRCGFGGVVGGFHWSSFVLVNG